MPIYYLRWSSLRFEIFTDGAAQAPDTPQNLREAVDHLRRRGAEIAAKMGLSKLPMTVRDVDQKILHREVFRCEGRGNNLAQY